MAERDPFFTQVLQYGDKSYEIGDPEAEITPIQQEQLFRRIEELASPPELDDPDFENDRAEGLSDDEIISWMQLRASDTYQVFGCPVFLRSNERLDKPLKETRLEILYYLRDLNIEMEEAIVSYNQETQEFNPEYRYRKAEITGVAARKLLVALGLRPTEPEIDVSERQAGAVYPDTRDHNSKLTQALWGKFMSLLELIATMKELGVTDTDDLNWQIE